MIGDLIKINPKQLPTLASPRQRKLPFWRRAWFKNILVFSALAGLMVYVGVMLWLRQFRERANEFDLTEMRKLEISTLVHDRNGKEFAELATEARRPVSLDEVPFHFIQALTAAEDGRFFEHHGVDYIGIVRAGIMNLKPGNYTQGASTVTQQLARQTFGKSDPTMLAKTKERKITEIFLAKRIEENFTKGQILEMYLNRIYFGSGCYGIAAAASRYFGKNVKDLDIPESATICGLIKRPDSYSPLRDLAAAQRNRNQVLNRMVDEHLLSRAEADGYIAKPVKVNPIQAMRGGGYLVDKVREEVKPILEELGYDETVGQGLHIYTTLDAEVQRAAEQSVKKRLTEIEQRKEYTAWMADLNQREDRKDKPRVTYQAYQATIDSLLRNHKLHPDGPPPIAPNPNYLQAAVTLLDNKTGEIIAMVGGRDYAHNNLNLAESKPGHAPGTSFLPFVYGAAFEDRMFPGTRLSDEPLDNSRIMVGSIEGILGEWGREGQNANFMGKITARGALIQGMNGASARLGLDEGLTKVRDFAARCGLGNVKDVPASLLGTSEVPLSELALAYTTFPNGGKHAPSTQILSKITDASGRILWQRGAAKSPVVATDDITSYMITSCLEDALSVGTGSPAKDYGLIDGAFAGKSGTHYEFRDLTFAGYSSEVTCVVWTGMKDRPETIYPSAFSNICSLPIWVDVMNAAAKTRPPQEFKIPEKIQQVELCAVSGLRATDRCFAVVEDPETHRRIYAKTTYKEFIRPGFKYDQLCDVHVSANSREGVQPEEAAQRPDIVLDKNYSASKDATLDGSGGSPIPVAMRAPIVVGNDPYNSLQPSLQIEGSAPKPTGDTPSGPSILTVPDVLKRPKIDIPAPPSVNIR